MPKDIREYYSVLELNPGASLDEIKRAYRQLLQRWHPDHYKPGSVMQTTAEDITKDLNEAYNQLCRKKRYLEFRVKAQVKKAPAEKRAAPEPWSAPVHQARKTYEQGAGIPRETPRPTPPPAQENARSVPPRAAAVPSAPPRDPPPFPRWSVPRPKPAKFSVPLATRKKILRRAFRWSRRTRAIAAGFALAIVVVWQWRSLRLPWRPSTALLGTPARVPSTPVVSQVAAAAPAFHPKTETRGISFQAQVSVPLTTFAPTESPLLSAPFFGSISMPARVLQVPAFAVGTLTRNKLLDEAVGLLDRFERGDSKARVLAVQGPPDEADEDIFRYGSSLVYFKEGRVVDWYDGRPSLRVLILPSFEFEGLTTFSVGSTKSEVIRIQGLPTNTTRTAFYYGASVVYFDREWVTSWVEVDQHLRARLMPTMDSFNLNQFAGH